MESKYTVLHFLSVCLKVFSIIIVGAGIGIGIALVAASSTSSLSILKWGSGIFGAVEIVVVFIVGILIYANAELIDCFVDIEANTRGTYYNTKPKKIALKTASLKNNAKLRNFKFKSQKN